MMKRSLKLFALVFVLVSLFVAAGCAEVEEAVEPEEEQETAEAAGETVVTDQMGREVVIKGVPERIISLTPANTEIVFALGLADNLFGVTEYCEYPPEAQEKEIVGDFASPSIEKVIELEPDLVLASTMHQEQVYRLEELEIAVLVVEPWSVEELYDSISLVAEMTGTVTAGEDLIASMQERIEAVQDVVGTIDPEDRVKVYYEVYSDPLMSAGPGVFVNDIITLAGGINIFGDVDESYPMISPEAVVEMQPEVILFPAVHGTSASVTDMVLDRPGWESIPAIKENRVYVVSDDSFANPSTRMVDNIEEAAKLFYPDQF